MMRAAFAAVLLLASGASAVDPSWWNVADDEPHVVHRFVSVHGKKTEIRTRLSDLSAAGFKIGRVDGIISLSRDGQEWTGHDATLIIAQWIHTRQMVEWQRERIETDKHYTVASVYYPHYPDRRDPVNRIVKVSELKAAGYKPWVKDSGQPVLLDKEGREISGIEKEKLITRIWHQSSSKQTQAIKRMMKRQGGGGEKDPSQRPPQRRASGPPKPPENVESDLVGVEESSRIPEVNVRPSLLAKSPSLRYAQRLREATPPAPLKSETRKEVPRPGKTIPRLPWLILIIGGLLFLAYGLWTKKKD